MTPRRLTPRRLLVVITLPWIAAAGELKTKPTQHTVQKLREIGIQPDVLLCRADRAVPDEEREKRAAQREATVEALCCCCCCC